MRTQISKAAELTRDPTINISVRMVKQAYYPVWEALAEPEGALEYELKETFLYTASLKTQEHIKAWPPPQMYKNSGCLNEISFKPATERVRKQPKCSWLL